MPKIHENRLYQDYIAMPWCLKIELVHGCNLRCKFCPVSVDPLLQKKETREFIDLELLAKFCREYEEMRQKYSPKSHPRIELAQRGEPTLHPNLLECLQTIRRELPSCQVTLFSNGSVMLKSKTFLREVFRAGLNILYVDCYNDTYTQMETHANTCNSKNEYQVFDARDFTPYRLHKNGHKLKVVSLIVGLEDQENSLSTRKIHNVGGSVPEQQLVQLGWKPTPNLPLKKNCYHPYREIVMHSDGNIVVCCVDWYPTPDTILGNVNEQSVEEIWFGEPHLRALRALWDKNRDWGLCKTCDYFGGYRLGLLQNPYIQKGN